jgi:ceramide glucosyltransferase
LVPLEFAASAIQYPIFWALLAWALSLAVAPTWYGLAIVALAWAGRAIAASGIDSALGLVAQRRATAASILLLPLRDLLSIVIVLASYWSDRVEWRGQIMHTSPETPPEPDAYPRPEGP